MAISTHSGTGGPDSSKNSAAPLRIWHCSHPRTASNLLGKQFNDHPQLATKPYLFLNAFFFGPERRSTVFKGTIPPGTEDATYQKCYDELRSFVADNERQGKTIFFKEHMLILHDPDLEIPNSDNTKKFIRQFEPNFDEDCPKNGNSKSQVLPRRSNPTVLPDSFMRTLSPIIQIRHPAITIPSYYRAGFAATGQMDLDTASFVNETSYRWDRMMFEWYCENVFPNRKTVDRGYASWPLVIDGDDLVNDNERITSAICELAGLDKTGVTRQWQPNNEEMNARLPKHIQVFAGTLGRSSGVVKSGREGSKIDIEKEMDNWKNEFGVEIAGKLKKATEAALEDYLYLMQYRI